MIRIMEIWISGKQVLYSITSTLLVNPNTLSPAYLLIKLKYPGKYDKFFKIATKEMRENWFIYESLDSRT